LTTRGIGTFVAAVLALLASAVPAWAGPVARDDADYQRLGRVFPDPLAGCAQTRSPICSPHAQGNQPATQFIGYQEFIDGLRFLNSKPQWRRYLEVWALDGQLGPGGDANSTDGGFPGNNLGRLEFKPDPRNESAGIPTTARDRLKSDLLVARVTDETVPDRGKKRYTLSLSIHGIERAGAEGGIRTMEDFVTAATTDLPGVGPRTDAAILPENVEAGAPTHGEVLRKAIIYFTFPNPDGWRRGSVSEGGVFFQRYNGNGVDPNRDWPDIGFGFRPYSGLSEPESRAFSSFWRQVKEDHGRWHAGDDLHGMLFADALSYTLMPHGLHNFKKDIRIRESSKTINRATYEGTRWSPTIIPNGQPLGPCEGADLGLGAACATRYGQTWGTVYDTINYTTTGALGDYFDSPQGLDSDGIDNEMAHSHLDRNIVFDPHNEQLHVDGNKFLILARLAEILNPPTGLFDAPGRKGYVRNQRFGRRQREYQPGAPPGTRPQDTHTSGTPTPDPGGFAFTFPVERGNGIYNGGMRVDATTANFQGVATGVVTLKVQCKNCDDHPQPGGRQATPDEWITVAEDFNQSPIYAQAGVTAAVNNPDVVGRDGQPVQWRALVSQEAVAPTIRVEFSSGAASIDGNTEAGPPPLERGYDVANTDFFRVLDRQVLDRDEDFDPVVPRQVIAGRQRLSPFRSIVLADNALPGNFSAGERQRYFDRLRAYVNGGGNLVLTDGAIQALPEFTSLPAEAIQKKDVYLGQIAFATSNSQNTLEDPLARYVNQPGSRFNSGMRRQTFEPTPLGFAIQNPNGGDFASAPQWDIDRAAVEQAGGRVAATSQRGTATNEQADFTRATMGEFKVGKGQVRFLGALLPQPTNNYDHPLGLEPFAVTYTGYILIRNLLDPLNRLGPPPGSAESAQTRRQAGRNFIISRRAVKLSRRGVARVRVSCRIAQGTCRGVLRLRVRRRTGDATRRRDRLMPIGRRRFNIPRSRKRNYIIRVRLSNRGRARVSRVPRRVRVRARANVRFSDGTRGIAHRRFWLYRPVR
jgi:hypothetical protein